MARSRAYRCDTIAHTRAEKNYKPWRTTSSRCRTDTKPSARVVGKTTAVPLPYPAHAAPVRDTGMVSASETGLGISRISRVRPFGGELLPLFASDSSSAFVFGLLVLIAIAKHSLACLSKSRTCSTRPPSLGLMNHLSGAKVWRRIKRLIG